MAAAEIAETLLRALPGASIESWDAADQPVVVVPAGALVDAARALRDTPELNFSFLAEMTAADYWPKEPRFEVVYHLASIGVKDFPRPGMGGTARRLRLKVRVGAGNAAAELPTLQDIWPNVNWYEREVYDLFGVVFAGHPDLAADPDAGRVGRSPGAQGLPGPGQGPGDLLFADPGHRRRVRAQHRGAAGPRRRRLEGPAGRVSARMPGARGGRAAAFDGRCIPPDGVAAPSEIPRYTLPRRALSVGHLVHLGATRHVHHELHGPAIDRSRRAGAPRAVAALATGALDTVRRALADAVAVQQGLDAQVDRIAEAAAICWAALAADRRVLVFGNGGSAAEAQHFAAELSGRFARERRALPALALTTDTSVLTAVGNDYGFERVFGRQVEAFGRPGDVAVGLSTSGTSPNIVDGLRTARPAA